MFTDKYKLKTEQLRQRCDKQRFSFETTAELPLVNEIIGQPRGVRAIEFGIDMKSGGYNIYVLGPTGTGRLTAVERFIRERAEHAQTPDDWMYVHNFQTPHQPKALHLPAGRGSQFHTDMQALVTYLQEQLPRAFEGKAYQEAARLIHKRYEEERDTMYRSLREKAADAGLALVQSEAGLALVPVVDGKLMEPEVYDALPAEERYRIDQARRKIEDALEEELAQMRQLEISTQQKLDDLARQITTVTVDAHMDPLKTKWEQQEAVSAYLNAVYEDIIANAHSFETEGKSPLAADPFWRYRVNLFVDHKALQGAPVMVVDQPTFQQLMGQIEQQMRMGAVHTDHTMIKPGALHRANGGYLIVRAIDVFRQPYAWEALKRALTAGEIRIENPDVHKTTAYVLQTPEPEAIPLDAKVVLLGTPWLYYTLYDQEDDFPELFKVKSDFATEMDRTPENEEKYAWFIAARCRESGLPHFDRGAVARVIEYGARLAEHQQKLSTRFGDIADIVHEAAYWAQRAGKEVVTLQDVEQSLQERRYRHNLDQQLAQDQITKDQTVFILTEGEAVGQMNSLSVTGAPDYMYGLPGRLTAQVYAGRDDLTQIDREVNLAGPIHNKGLLTIRAYLSAKYAQEQQLSISASLSFEQNYSHVDGDSASSAELYALISAISRLPIKQGIAATGSVNQLGQIQPIGGVNEKIEGYFDICQANGLTGAQGVLIPKANLGDLMLKDEVIEAVAAGRFHLWAIESVDEGLEVLTEKAAGAAQEDGTYPEETINRAVIDKLKEWEEKERKNKEDDEDDEDDDEEEETDLEEEPDKILNDH